MYNLDMPALASNHVNILRVNYKYPQYIAFVINSLIGRLQTERLSTGSAQQELYPKDIDNFIIPLVREDIQIQIEKNINEFSYLQKQSKKLLKYAVKIVEIAIEKDEKVAVSYFENLSLIDELISDVSKKQTEEVIKKRLAFERLEAWRNKNKDIFNKDFNWKKELEDAIDEKYGLTH